MIIHYSSLFLCFLFFSHTLSFVRVKRDDEQRPGGVEAPASLSSIITCYTPINRYLCFGPRAEILRPTKIAQTERIGLFSGYHNGVDIGLIKPLNIPMIEQEEIGTHIGATVDVQPTDGVVEWGTRNRVYKAWKHNAGGVVEFDRDGVGLDIGSRASAADDGVKLKWTHFGVNVGPRDRPITKMGAVQQAKFAALKPPLTVASIYPGYYTHRDRDDWYRQTFRRNGDEYRTPQQRGCPWCVVFDGLN